MNTRNPKSPHQIELFTNDNLKQHSGYAGFVDSPMQLRKGNVEDMSM